MPILFSRFEGSVLKIDTPYDITLTESEKTALTNNFHFQKNIINSNLEYRLKTDINIVIKGISILEDNNKIVRYAYFDDAGNIQTSDERQQGNQITYLTRGKTESELDEIIERRLPISNYEGYYGSFETFGKPFVDQGYFCNIADSKYPERDGRYVAKAVQTNFGVDGYRQNITLGMES